jgi:phenylacetyl-CoA:acceptor oxidoreductase 26-kDa subunit
MIGKLQTMWDARAALNFMLGGAGAGLLAASVFFRAEPFVPVLVALALIGAGLGAVWLEIGRKLRAIHVFFNPFTSWMTREAFVAVVVFVLALSALALRNQLLYYAAALAALGFLYCQARILFGAKGIPTWRAREVVPLIVTTGLAEGLGLALLFEAPAHLLVLFAVAVILRAWAWARYRAAVKSSHLVSAGTVLLRLGTLAALALAVLGFFVPLVAPLAGLAALAAGWNFKFRLVTRAAIRQDFTLPHLPIRGAR